MSLQQVNLYQDELIKKKLNYSALMVLQLNMIMVVVFSLAAGFSYFQLQQNQEEFVDVQQKNVIAMNNLQKIQAEFGKRKKDALLVKKITEKSKDLSNKQKVLAILIQNELGNTKGFVEHVSGLARQRLQGLWLTQIRIAGGGANIALYGTTVKSSLVPKYLQQLSAEKAFVGTEFKSLLMERQEKKKQWMNFSLKNISKKANP